MDSFIDRNADLVFTEAQIQKRMAKMEQQTFPIRKELVLNRLQWAATIGLRNLSAEGLLSLQPTLVLGEHDMGPPAVVDQLAALGLDLLVVPERFDAEGVADKIRCVAAAVGRTVALSRHCVPSQRTW